MELSRESFEKAGQDSGYVPEEVELVKAVAAQAVLVMEGLCCLHEQVELSIP